MTAFVICSWYWILNFRIHFSFQYSDSALLQCKSNRLKECRLVKFSYLKQNFTNFLFFFVDEFGFYCIKHSPIARKRIRSNTLSCWYKWWQQRWDSGLGTKLVFHGRERESSSVRRWSSLYLLWNRNCICKSNLM